MTDPLNLDLALMDHDDGGPYVVVPTPAGVLGAAPINSFGMPAPTGSPPMHGVRLDEAGWLDLLDRLTWPLPPSVCVGHHTYRPTQDTWQGLATLRAIQNFYRQTYGWPAMPHFFAAPDGLWVANPLDRPGIHAGLGNCNIEYQKPYWGGGPLTWWSLGLEMVWDGDQSMIGGPVWQYGVLVMGSLSRKLNIAPRKLVTLHRDYSTKTCPGLKVSREAIHAAVEAWVEAHAPTTAAPLPATPATPSGTPETPTHRVVRATAARQAPRAGAPIAWGGQATLPVGQDLALTPTEHVGWGHWEPAGFIPTSAVAPLQPPRSYTPHSGLLLAGAPAVTAEQAAEWADARGSRYPLSDLLSIARSVWKWAPLVWLDPVPLWSQLTKEASAQIDDDPGYEFLSSWWAERPRRNGCGNGVTGKIATAPAPGYIRDVGSNRYSTWAQLPDGRWAEGLSFPTWDLSIQAQVGRLLRYVLPADAPTTAEERRLMAFALKLRPLDRVAWGSVSELIHLGAIHNPANAGKPRSQWKSGWAWDGATYGASLATTANAIISGAR